MPSLYDVGGVGDVCLAGPDAEAELAVVEHVDVPVVRAAQAGLVGAEADQLAALVVVVLNHSSSE